MKNPKFYSKDVTCIDCKTPIYKYGGTKRCRICYMKSWALIKVTHPRWKGGVSRAYTTGYYSNEYKEWRKSVFDRDGYCCRVCSQSGYITAHHIKSFAHYPDLRFEITNGITLCEDCHKLTDNYKGRNKGRVPTLDKN